MGAINSTGASTGLRMRSPQHGRRVAGRRECLKATHGPPTLLDAPQSEMLRRLIVACVSVLRLRYAFNFTSLTSIPRHMSKLLRKRLPCCIPLDLHDVI